MRDETKRNERTVQKDIKGKKCSVLNYKWPKPFLGDTSACTQEQDINNQQFCPQTTLSPPHMIIYAA